MMWSYEHAKVVSELFESLNLSGIKWMVIRNYDGLPENNRSKDIDLVFDNRDFELAEKIIISKLKELNFSRMSKRVFQYAWCYTFFKIINNEIISIKIDFVDGFVWRGAHLFTFDELYVEKMSYKNFYVPDKIVDGFLLWAKTLLTGGFIKEKYKNDTINALNMNPEKFFRLINLKFGHKYTNVIFNLIKNGEIEKTTKLQKNLCYISWFKEFCRNPKKTLIDALQHTKIEILRRIKRPKGTIIAVAGPDGVGKTTFVETLKSLIAKYLIKEPKDIKIIHFRPNLFPNLKELFTGKESNKNIENFYNPHRAKPVKGINALLRITYYWFDYILGYWLVIRKNCINGQVYIFDRYFFDFIVDPHRSRISLPRWIRFLYWKIIPKPDLIFILNNDPKLIYERKQELTLVEIERQLEEYKKIAQTSSKFKILDANRYPEEIAKDAIKEIILINSVSIS